MKKYTYILVALLALVSGLVWSNWQMNEKMKSADEALPLDDKQAALDERKKWEASPDGVMYKQWEASPEGKKVNHSYDVIKNRINDFTEMEAVVTSVTFQRTNVRSSSPRWLIINIEGETYMMQFVPKEFQQLSSLKVNDKIIVKSRNAGFSPNHPYLILSGDYIEHHGKVLFKRDVSKTNRC